MRGLAEIAARRGVPFSADHAGTMWGFFFRDRLPWSFAEAQQGDLALFKRFFHAALGRGLSFAPSPYEASFMSAAHGVRELEQTFERFDDPRARLRLRRKVRRRRGGTRRSAPS